METIVKQYTKENALSHILNVITEKGYEVSINGEVVNKNSSNKGITIFNGISRFFRYCFCSIHND